ncbi:MAG TPA: hypothetical protein VF030_09455 [Solirubrobacterales bacterium]
MSRLKHDRALAEGADPSASRELALRAEQLQQQRVRERTAKGFDHLIQMNFAEPGPCVSPSMLPLRHERVRRNLELLQELADALRAPRPHAVQGLAMASALLEDAHGPLYESDPDESLDEVLDTTLSELES